MGFEVLGFGGFGFLVSGFRLSLDVVKALGFGFRAFGGFSGLRDCWIFQGLGCQGFRVLRFTRPFLFCTNLLSSCLFMAVSRTVFLITSAYTCIASASTHHLHMLIAVQMLIGSASRQLSSGLARHSHCTLPCRKASEASPGVELSNKTSRTVL